MKNYCYYLIGITLLAFSCEKAELEPTPFKEGAVHFKALKAGQESRFIRYTLHCNDFDESFQWTGDTLVLQVIEEGTELYFQESLTPQSPLYFTRRGCRASHLPRGKTSGSTVSASTGGF